MYIHWALRSLARRAEFTIISYPSNFVKLFSSSKCTKIFPETTSERLGGGGLCRLHKSLKN